jgi:hypothetical protein
VHSKFGDRARASPQIVDSLYVFYRSVDGFGADDNADGNLFWRMYIGLDDDYSTAPPHLWGVIADFEHFRMGRRGACNIVWYLQDIGRGIHPDRFCERLEEQLTVLPVIVIETKAERQCPYSPRFKAFNRRSSQDQRKCCLVVGG